jgi:hypothetical protein
MVGEGEVCGPSGWLGSPSLRECHAHSEGESDLTNQCYICSNAIVIDFGSLREYMTLPIGHLVLDSKLP